MNPISVVVNLYNEGEYLEESFTQLSAHVDEFVVIDQGSTDNTVEIARQFTDKVFLFPRVYYSYAYISQACLMARNEWVFKPDADERYDPKILDALPKMLEADNDMIQFRMEYGGDSESFVTRLWKKSRVLWTDSFDSVPCLLEGCTPSTYTWDHGKVVNLRTRESAPKRYRIEGAKRLLARYGDTEVEPYKNYCDYYRRIISGEAT